MKNCRLCWLTSMARIADIFAIHVTIFVYFALIWDIKPLNQDWSPGFMIMVIAIVLMLAFLVIGCSRRINLKNSHNIQ